MITDRPWFGAGSVGMGDLPASLEGIVFVVLWLLAVMLAYQHFGESRGFANSAAGLVALLLLVSVLTGMPPG
jgi:hypothetical protein